MNFIGRLINRPVLLLGLALLAVAGAQAQDAAKTGAPAGNVIHYWKGTAITAIGSLTPAGPVDLVAAYNAAHDPDLTPDAGWTPTARTHVDPAWAVPALTLVLAGSH